MDKGELYGYRRIVRKDENCKERGELMEIGEL